MNKGLDKNLIIGSLVVLILFIIPPLFLKSPSKHKVPHELQNNQNQEMTEEETEEYYRNRNIDPPKQISQPKTVQNKAPSSFVNEIVAPVNSNSKTYQKAYSYYQNKDYDNAIDFFTKELAEHPQNAYAIRYRGFSYLKTGNYRKAIDDYQSAMTYFPQDNSIFFYTGYCKYQMKQFNDAAGDLQRALISDQNNLYARLMLADSLFQSAIYPQAADEASRYIAIKQDSYDAYIIRGKSYYLLGNYSEAKPDIEMALKLVPKDLEALYYNALICKKINGGQSAIDAFLELKYAAGEKVPEGFAYIEKADAEIAEIKQNPIATSTDGKMDLPELK